MFSGNNRNCTGRANGNATTATGTGIELNSGFAIFKFEQTQRTNTNARHANDTGPGIAFVFADPGLAQPGGFGAVFIHEGMRAGDVAFATKRAAAPFKVEPGLIVQGMVFRVQTNDVLRAGADTGRIATAAQLGFDGRL